MATSGPSSARSSSYEKPCLRDGARGGREGAAMAPLGGGAGRRLAARARSAPPPRSPAAARCRPMSAAPTRWRSPPNPASPLVKIAEKSSPSPELTGVRLLPLGSFSLDTRIQLAQRAATLARRPVLRARERSDRAPADARRCATRRCAACACACSSTTSTPTHSDELLRGLASFPNVEVHLFNPFCCARSSGVAGRYTASIFDFGRLNHRMHNKLFIADGVMAVAGGRNIADEYFLRSAHDATSSTWTRSSTGARGQGPLGDLRPLLEQRGRLPDRQHRRAARRQGGAAQGVRRDDGELPPSPPTDPPPTTCSATGRSAEELDAGQIGLIWGMARAFADPPEKLLAMTPKIAFEMSVTNDVMMTVWQAKKRARPHLAVHDPGRRRA